MYTDDLVELWAEEVPQEFQQQYGRFSIWLGTPERKAIIAGVQDPAAVRVVTAILGPRVVVLARVWKTLGGVAMLAAVKSALRAPDADLN